MIRNQYWINGRHYSMTLEAWLRRQDSQKAEIMSIMAVLLFPDASLFKQDPPRHAKCKDLKQSTSFLHNDPSWINKLNVELK